MSTIRLFRTLALVLCAALPLAHADAQDEREDTTPTASIWLANVTVATIDSWINQGYRITDLEVNNAAATRFTVTMVRNSGAYQVTGWWWYYGLTSSQARTLLTQNLARPIDIEPYTDSSSNLRFAIVMVSNLGSQAKQYQTFFGSTATQIIDWVTNNGYRIVDIDGYTSSSSRVYTAVAIRNTGPDARSWWVYVNRTRSQISTLISQNSARIVDLDPVGNGNYDVVMNRVSGKWWYVYNLSIAQLSELSTQIGARVVDVEPNGSTYDAVLTNNSNELTTRISEILRNNTNGQLGALLRRIDGNTSTVLAAIHPETPFEPASTIKTLVHLYAMRQVATGAINLDRVMRTYLTEINTSCPQRGGAYTDESLRSVLSQMMEQSSNTRTRTVTDFFGLAAINNFATTGVGISRTSINHIIGCGGPPANQTTLSDLARLHDRVADGYIGSHKSTFYELMINEPYYPRVGTLSIDSMILAEAATAGITGSALAAFRSGVHYAAKGGNYDYPGSNSYHGSYFGYLRLPFVVNGRIVGREYAMGTFFHNSTNKTAAFNAIGTAYCELVRDEVRAALLTFRGVTIGSTSIFGSGCRGSNNFVPDIRVSGSPDIGGQTTYQLALGPAGRPTALYLGTSNTLWNAMPLPADLGPLGAPGCLVLTNPVVAISTVLNGNGAASVPVPIPNSPALINRAFFTQFWVLDPPANRLGLITSRACRTLVGTNLQ